MSVLGRGKRAAARVLLCSPRWEMCCFNIASAARTAPTEAWPGIALLLLDLQENGRRCEVTSNCALILRLLVSSHAWSRRLCSPHPAAGATMPVKLLLTAASLPRGGRSCNALAVGLNDENTPVSRSRAGKRRRDGVGGEDGAWRTLLKSRPRSDQSLFGFLHTLARCATARLGHASWASTFDMSLVCSTLAWLHKEVISLSDS
jgi:hypothetical protein